MSYSGNFGRVFPPPYGQQFVNYQGLLINVVGTTGPFLMPQNQPLNTLNLLTVTSMPGVPTSTPPGGSFAYNSATNVVYVYIAGTGWIPITGGGAVETWAQTLVAGNTSGATNPILSAGRTLIFEDNICIGGSNLPLISTTAAILIGDSVTPGGVQCVQVGKATTALGAGCTLIGSSTSGNGANATALGYGAQALGVQATSLGYNAFSGTNATAVGVNAIANGAQGSAFGYNATAVAFTNATAVGTGATAVQNSEVVLGSQTTLTRIAGTQLQFGQDPFNDVAIVIGTLLSPASANPLGGIAIGLFASAAAANSTCVGTNANDGAWGGSTVIGPAASASGLTATAIGNTSKAGTRGAALGASAWATGTSCVALGDLANTGAFTKSVGLGWSSTPTANNQIRMGTATETVSVPGALVMPSALAVGETFKFITLSGVAGTPSGAALEGSLAMDTTNHLAYLRTNSAWVQIVTGAVGASALSAVLAVGNTTGANDISVNASQNINFVGAVRIGSNAAGVLAGTSATSIFIGGGSGSASARTNAVCVGAGALAGGNDVTAIGSGANGSGVQAVAIGRSSTSSGGLACGSLTTAGSNGIAVGTGASASGVNTIAIGSSATTNAITGGIVIGGVGQITGNNGVAIGAGGVSAAAEGVAIGSLANTSTSTNCICIGSNAISALGCNNSIQIGASTTATASATGAICIGYQSGADATDSISIGRATTARGTSSIAIGAAISTSNTNTTCILIGSTVSIQASSVNSVLVGAGITSSNPSATGNVAVGQGITFSVGTAQVDCIALGRGATVPSAATKAFYLPTGMTTVAASVAVNYNTATGQIYPVTSARKFKQNIRDLEGVDRILNAVPRKYNMAKGHCHCPPDSGCDGTCCEEVGVIADEMEAAGLSDFVVYGDHERKEAVGVLYDRMVVPLIAVVKSQQERLDILEEQLAKLLSSKL